MTSASAIARPPPPAAWVRHPSAGHPRPSGRLSPLHPCSFDHDQDRSSHSLAGPQTGTGLEPPVDPPKSGRSCRVRLPARPSSLGLEADYAALSHPSRSSLSVDRGSRGGRHGDALDTPATPAGRTPDTPTSDAQDRACLRDTSTPSTPPGSAGSRTHTPSGTAQPSPP